MDSAGDELGRIVAFVNRRTHLLYPSTFCASLDGKTSEKPISNYFSDRLGVVSESGDTSTYAHIIHPITHDHSAVVNFAHTCHSSIQIWCIFLGLHRICAWNPTPNQFEAFLNHMKTHRDYHSLSDAHIHDDFTENALAGKSDQALSYNGMPAPPSLSATNHMGVTALHVAVYHNSFHAQSIVQQLLKQQKELASIPMNCGSYPLHILCGHNVTIRKEVLQELLLADPSVVWKEDYNGDTPLSLLWKNVLRFRWAQQDKIVLEAEEEEDSIVMMGYYNSPIQNRRRRSRPSWMTMISPDQFVEYSLMMIQAALNKQMLRLVDICRIPRCPPHLIQLAIQYAHKSTTCCSCLDPDLLAADDMGMSALHQAAQNKPGATRFIPVAVLEHMNSVVDILVETFPCMALQCNNRGRIALHYALERGIGKDGLSAEELYRLVEANPDSLGIRDPVSGLYPFALLAASNCRPAQLRHDWMETDEPPEVPKEQVDSIFTLLRHLPEAAIYGH